MTTTIRKTASSTRKTIMLAHGGGGQLTDQLIAEAILPRLGNSTLNTLMDSAVIMCDTNLVAFTIDSYVVTPWQFPGGDIGKLAVSGTVNDLAVCGAEPSGIALSLILAEGFSRKNLDIIIESIAATSKQAGVRVMTGDTKVVGHNQADGIYITTAGVGRVQAGRQLSPARVEPGDVILINGTIGEHGLAVMLTREMPEVQTVLRTDAAPLNGLIKHLLAEVGNGVKFMRDPTRSGLAGVMADLAAHTGLHVTLEETDVPVRPEARHAADMLGLDPLEVANEGKVVVVVHPDAAEKAAAVMREHELGRDTAIIGRVHEPGDGLCEVHTNIGGRRILSKPYGEQLPRIC